MQWYRQPILSFADLGPVRSFTEKSSLVSGLVSRFVAGQTLEEALPKVEAIAATGITATLDELGENVASESEASAAVETFVRSLRMLAERGLEPNISIKLTMLGLDLSDAIAEANAITILQAAREVHGFVRIDMEASAYTERTLHLFEKLHDQFPDEVGIVIQTYLYRSRADIERLIARKARVRLVKGAYSEPSSVAFASTVDRDDNYLRLMYLLLENGNYPAIATHDTGMINAAKMYATDHRIAADRFEFQMLYGVRRDLQTSLAAEGYRMRVYIPFGTAWYPYFTRRIAERPANATFVLRQFVDRNGGK
ncbi:MAG TPA: proline dehydrogenase family protein [Thermomicrobiales bacterium]|nr:proline dehydrogenase family protein [Thermomicrobiales bacterium]